MRPGAPHERDPIASRTRPIAKVAYQGVVCNWAEPSLCGLLSPRLRRLADRLLNPGYRHAAQNEPAGGGQVEQVDVDAGIGDLAEHGCGPARAVLDRSDDDGTLVALDMVPG